MVMMGLTIQAARLLQVRPPGASAAIAGACTRECGVPAIARRVAPGPRREGVRADRAIHGFLLRGPRQCRVRQSARPAPYTSTELRRRFARARLLSGTSRDAVRRPTCRR